MTNDSTTTTATSVDLAAHLQLQTDKLSRPTITIDAGHHSTDGQTDTAAHFILPASLRVGGIIRRNRLRKDRNRKRLSTILK